MILLIRHYIRISIYTLFALVASFLCFVSPSYAAMVIWTEHSTIKIGSPPAVMNKSVAISAARNEFEPFQVIVRAEGENLSGVNISSSPLVGPGGFSITGRDIMIYREAFINVTTPSTIEGRTGAWPDALIPQVDAYFGETRNGFPFSVQSGIHQPLWIEVYVPTNAPAGDYTGALTVTAAGKPSISVPVKLTVYPFSLPSTSTLKSAFGIEYQRIPQGHGLGNYSNTQAQNDLIKLYTEAGLVHRVTNSYLPTGVSLEGINGDGSPKWTKFDALWGGLIQGTESLPNQWLPGARFTTVPMGSINSSRFDNEAYVRSYVTHAKSQGWFDRLYQYTFDEPRNQTDFDWVVALATILHGVDPLAKTMVTTSVQNATKYGARESIDLLVPTIRFMDNKPSGQEVGSVEPPGGADTIGNQRAKYPTETWWYQACGSHGCGIMGGGPDDPNGYHTGWPSYMIDLPAMYSRVMQWMAFKYDIQGEL